MWEKYEAKHNTQLLINWSIFHESSLQDLMSLHDEIISRKYYENETLPEINPTKKFTVMDGGEERLAKQSIYRMVGLHKNRGIRITYWRNYIKIAERNYTNIFRWTAWYYAKERRWQGGRTSYSGRRHDRPSEVAAYRRWNRLYKRTKRRAEAGRYSEQIKKYAFRIYIWCPSILPKNDFSLIISTRLAHDSLS